MILHRLRRSLDLILALAAAWLAAGLALAGGGPAWLRIGLGLPLVLVWPGYALTMWACPRRAHGLAHTAAYWVGLSLIVTALGGMALHFAPGGITARNWALFLGGATTLCCAGAAWRRRSNGQAACLPAARQMLKPVGGLIVAGGVVIGAIAWARWGALQQPRPGFTQLWIAPVEGEAAPAWRVGVRNVEHSAQTYRLVITLDGETLLTARVRGLEPGMTWELPVSWPAAPGSKLEALLYLGDEAGEPYRRVIWWVQEGD